MIGKAFEIRRRRRWLWYEDVAKITGISVRLIVQYEAGHLHATRDDQLDKLNELNKKWTIEDYYGEEITDIDALVALHCPGSTSNHPATV